MGLTESDIGPALFLEDVEMRVGEVVDVQPFPDTRKDLYKLRVDFGGELRQSAAGLTDYYDAEDLLGAQVVAVCTLGTVTVAGFESECLVTGVVHLTTERDVEPGTQAY